MWNPFKKIKKMITPELPRVGSIWRRRSEDNPFTMDSTIEIIAVKDGWVQYYFLPSKAIPWELSIRDLKLVYKEVRDDYAVGEDLEDL